MPVSTCSGCRETFGSASAFDAHQYDDGRKPACRELLEYAKATRPGGRPRLVWHPVRNLWVTRLDDRDHTRAGQPEPVS